MVKSREVDQEKRAPVTRGPLDITDFALTTGSI